MGRRFLTCVACRPPAGDVLGDIHQCCLEVWAPIVFPKLLEFLEILATFTGLVGSLVNDLGLDLEQIFLQNTAKRG
jgi:hypothetical protein